MVSISFCILVPILCGTLILGEIIIESNKVTNWGPWGEWNECPEGEYASAFQLKTESNQGGGNADDSGLNAIRLFCADPSNTNEPDLENPITSTEAQFGDWGQVFYCDGGIITGFQLRQEGELGGAIIDTGILLDSKDDTAANNLRVYCSNHNDYIEGDGTGWGGWGTAKKCLKAQAVCGIQTQVEEYTKSVGGIRGGDYTALNNVNMKCCDIVSPAETCIPEDHWDTVLKCDGISRGTGYKCTYQLKKGVQKGTSSSNGGSQSSTHEAGASASVGGDIKALSVNFEVNYSYSSTTGFDWQKQSSSTWTTETTSTADFDVKPGYVSVLKQVVGTCGDFTVYTAVFKLEDYDSNGNLVNSSPIVK